MSWSFVLPVTVVSFLLSGLFLGWIAMKIFGEDVAKLVVAVFGGFTLAKITPANELAMNVGIGLGVVLLAVIVLRRHPAHG